MKRSSENDFQKVRSFCFIIINLKGPYSQSDFKSRLTKHDLNHFQIGNKVDIEIWKLMR